MQNIKSFIMIPLAAKFMKRQPRLFFFTTKFSTHHHHHHDKTKTLIEWEKTSQYKNHPNHSAVMQDVNIQHMMFDNGIELTHVWRGCDSVISEKKSHEDVMPTFFLRAKDIININFRKDFDLYLVQADEKIIVRKTGNDKFHHEFPNLLFNPTLETIDITTDWYRNIWSNEQYIVVAYKIFDKKNPSTITGTYTIGSNNAHVKFLMNQRRLT